MSKAVTGLGRGTGFYPEKNVISMSSLDTQRDSSHSSHLARRFLIGIALILAIAYVEYNLFVGQQISLSEFWTIIAAELLIMVPGIVVWILRPDLYARILGRRVSKEETPLIQVEVKRPETAPRPAPKVHTERPFGEARLDPRYEHVQLHVFWPLHHSIPVLSNRFGHPKGIWTQSDMPKIKYVINYKTRKAFSVGGYAWGLIVPYRLIEMNSETHWCPFYAEIWLRKHGFHPTGRALTPTDLVEGSSLIPSQVTEPSAESIPLVMKTSDRGYDPDRAARLDPRLAGVHALFFWPKKYSWQRGERNPNINMPYTKVVIRGMEVFWWGTYAEDLFQKGRIDYNNAPGDFESEEDMERYLRENGFNLHKWPVSQADLLGEAVPQLRDKEVDMKRQQDRLRLVYMPLHNMILVLPKGLTVGTPVNAWSLYPERMREVARIFTDYRDLIENEDVWIGWRRNESALTRDEFWLGDDAYKWFDSIESEYNRIKLLLGE